MTNRWKIQAERNAAIDRGVAISVPGFEGWTFYVRPKHAWNYHFSRAAVRVAVSDMRFIDLMERAKEASYVPTAEDQALEALMERRAFAEGCVADWEGVDDENGKLLPFSVPAANRLFDHFPQIFEFLDASSKKIENFKPISDALKLELAAGNSKAGCATSSDHGETSSKPSQPAKRGTEARRAK